MSGEEIAERVTFLTTFGNLAYNMTFRLFGVNGPRVHLVIGGKPLNPFCFDKIAVNYTRDEVTGRLSRQFA